MSLSVQRSNVASPQQVRETFNQLAKAVNTSTVNTDLDILKELHTDAANFVGVARATQFDVTTQLLQRRDIGAGSSPETDALLKDISDMNRAANGANDMTVALYRLMNPNDPARGFSFYPQEVGPFHPIC